MCECVSACVITVSRDTVGQNAARNYNIYNSLSGQTKSSFLKMKLMVACTRVCVVMKV